MASEEKTPDFVTEIRIPRRKVSYLKKLKEELEKKGNVEIEISEGNLVKIKGNPIDCLTVKNVIQAIARGFPKEQAFLLFDERYTLCVLQIAKKKNDLIRIRARLIGTKGKAKREIEKLANVKIAISGKTIAIIGEYENVENARIAIERLIAGAKHSNVFALLRKLTAKF